MSRARLALALAAATAVALGTPALVLRALDAFEVDRAEVGLDVLDPVDEGLESIRDSRANASGAPRWSVAYLGDSMVIAYKKKDRVPALLQLALEQTTREPGRVHVASLAAPGMNPFDYYFLADRIAREHPDQVILPVNLAAFSRVFLVSFSRPELAAFLSPSRIPEALGLPLSEVRLTVDRLLVWISLAGLGLEEPWRELVSLQARVGRARRELTNEIGRRIGGNTEVRFEQQLLNRLKERQLLPNTQRFNSVTMRDRYGVAFDGIDPSNPSLRVLAAAIRVFRAHGCEVLVYATPMNVEHAERLGVVDPAGLARTLASIEQVAESEGARFLDLHAILPDEGFRDGAGHLAGGDGPVHGPRSLAKRLVPAVLGAAREASRGADTAD